MRVSAKVDYALRATVELAAAPPGPIKGERIATAIFPAREEFAYFWGGAMWRSHQILRPNEAVFWYTMRLLRERGIPLLDMGGGGAYKRKYGPRERRIPFLRKSRVRGMMALRDVAARIQWYRATRRGSGA